MSGRPRRARHTAGRSGVNRESRMPLPKSFPSDRRRRHASLRAEAHEYHGTLLYHHKCDTATALCRRMCNGVVFQLFIEIVHVFRNRNDGTTIRSAANLFGFNITYSLYTQLVV